MNIALIGPSGAGKGTHALQLIKHFNLLPLVTGDLLRESTENHTAVGFLSQRYLSQGALVPDEVVDALVAERLWRTDPQQRVLFDGFPRTASQAQFLDTFFGDLGRQLDTVIYLEISDDKIVERVLNRLICAHCHAPYHLTFKIPHKAGLCDVCGSPLHKRPDDITEMLRVRQRAFQRVIKPVLDYYQQSRRLLVINADGPIEKVSTEIISAVQALQNKESRSGVPEETQRAPVIESKSRPPTRKKVAKAACHLILVGAPGSGKGTQAEALRDAFQLAHIATGDLFRENLKNQTDLGKLAKSYMDRGELVPDDVTEAMVEDRLAKSPPDSGFILDGFPRTLPQANALTEILNHFERPLDAALYIKVPDTVIEHRLSGRRVCRKCQTPYHLIYKQPATDGVCDLCGGELYQRDDDNPQTIRSRLATFHLQTTPIIKYYQEAGVLFEIDGQGDVATVTRSSLAVIKTIQDSLA